LAKSTLNFKVLADVVTAAVSFQHFARKKSSEEELFIACETIGSADVLYG